MMEEAIKHGGDGGAVAEQRTPASTGRFNAQSIFMRTPRFTEPIADHFRLQIR